VSDSTDRTSSFSNLDVGKAGNLYGMTNLCRAYTLGVAFIPRNTLSPVAMPFRSFLWRITENKISFGEMSQSPDAFHITG
jgi:hypothetical protein